MSLYAMTDIKEVTMWIGKVSRLIEKGLNVEHHREILDQLTSRLAELMNDDVVVVAPIERELTDEEAIEAQVQKTGGTWVKQRNARKRLIKIYNEKLQSEIEKINTEIRALISRPEQEKRELYRLKTNLELMKL